MSNAIPKAFEAVPQLKSDGTNYRLWLKRVDFAALGCNAKSLLATNTIPSGKEDEANQLLAAVVSKLPDSIFLDVASADKPKAVMDKLITRFGQTTMLSEADALQRLFSMKCKKDNQLQAHLDRLT
jgi:hypothetical protein